jgi:uncharacterized protein (DUF3820 family)
MNTPTDMDLMPFGKYKGKPMQDVPASYLHWLWTEGLKDQVATHPVAAYINQNLHALKKEYANGIWS